MADAFEGNPFFEVGVKRNGAVRVAGLSEDVDPAVFKAGKGFDVVVGVRELNLRGAIGAGREGDAVIRVWEVFSHEPPRDCMVFHGFQNEARGEGWGIVFHHLVVKAANGLDGAKGKVVFAVRIPKVEVVAAPGLHVTVIVTLKAEGEKSVGLVVHEVAADHVRGVVGEAAPMMVGS